MSTNSVSDTPDISENGNVVRLYSPTIDREGNPGSQPSPVKAGLEVYGWNAPAPLLGDPRDAPFHDGLPDKYNGLAEIAHAFPERVNDILPAIPEELHGAFRSAVTFWGQDKERRRGVLIDAAAVKEKRTKWLWAGRIPMGELTFIIGKGGVGKSTELARQVALITNGKMEGEFSGSPRTIIYVASEDSIEATVKPRMVAAGADLDRVKFFRMVAGANDEETRLILENDLSEVITAVRQVNAVAVFFDPLSSNLGGDRNKGNEMRPIMEKIRRAAEETGTAFVALGHVKKERVSNIIDAFLGSVEMSNVCRSAMGVIADDEEDGAYLLSQEKHNLGPKPLSLRYRIEGAEYPYESENGFTETMSTSRVVIIGETDRTASQVMEEAMQGDGAAATREAAEWLHETLERQGITPRQDVVKAARAEGISEASLKRAAKKLKVETSRQGFGSGSYWKLPDPPSSAPEAA